ncbi:hypothetical protein [Parasitella parasitica]|uniref:Autophagy-related protein 18 n=1 Tax=Parasitella parasitica TaxID=35722 RepID=A0A0B7MW01_9FUNG|nr:hypothetical protein [Parasitella parasitica]
MNLGDKIVYLLAQKQATEYTTAILMGNAILKRQTTICELSFPTAILAVKMNRRRLIVVLEEQIFLYDISNMKLLHTIETNPNPQAICALSPSSENCYIAYPARSSVSSPFSPNSGSSNLPFVSGDVELFEALEGQTTNIVQAHKSAVSCISMNSEGTLLATASEKGTVIRIFSTLDATKVYQFRRGTSHAKIYSMSFNLVSSLLCVSSDTETVHIFKLSTSGSPTLNGNGYNNAYNDQSQQQQQSQEKESRGKSSSMGNIAGSVGSYLPDVLTEILEPTRDFASLKLPSAGVRSLVALSSTTPQVMVVTSEGFFYQYNIDLESGGECVLLKQYSLLAPTDDKLGVDQ